MEFEEQYQPILNFIQENQGQLLYIVGMTNLENNAIQFYLPEKLVGDKSNQKLYVEFELPNQLIDIIIANQQHFQDLATSF